jgi:hypothetical protein
MYDGLTRAQYSEAVTRMKSGIASIFREAALAATQGADAERRNWCGTCPFGGCAVCNLPPKKKADASTNGAG